MIFVLIKAIRSWCISQTRRL